MRKFLFQDIALKFIFFEILAFLILYLIIGFSVSPEDPFFVTQPTSYFVVFLITVTLFYGLTGGMIAIFMSVAVMLYFYEKFPLDFFLWHLLLTLIAGEFHYYWMRKISLAEEERRFIEEKFEDVKRDLLLLRISHDQMERSYIIKPISVRKVLEDIKLLIQNENIPYKRFMELVAQACHIDTGAIFFKENKTFLKVAEVGDKVELNLEDPLVQNCMEKAEISYISQSYNKSSEYLAVVPVFDKNDEIVCILLIKKMPFLHLNADNIFSISVFLFWFVKEIEASRYISDLRKDFPDISPEFLKEFKKSAELKAKYGIEGSIVIFELPEEDKSFLLFLEDRIRGLDVLLRKNNSIFVLLPLTSISSCKGFIERIRADTIEHFGSSYWETLKYKIYAMEENPALLLKKIGF